MNRSHKVTGPLLAERFNSSDIKQLLVDDGAPLSQLEVDLEDAWGIEHGEIDLVAGGPPCQGFSGISFRRSYSVDKVDLPSNHLFQDMAYVVGRLRPKMFLFENVRGLLSAKWDEGGVQRKIWDRVYEAFDDIEDYTISWSLVRAADYGVPQNRPRVLLVGIRDDIALEARWSKTDEKNLELPAHGLLPSPSGSPAPDLIDVLGDLVDLEESNWKGGVTDSYPSPARKGIQADWFRRTLDDAVTRKGSPLTEHEYSNHSVRVRDKFQAMIDSSGEIPESMKTKKFAQRLLPKRWGEDGPTITATSLPDDYVHFEQPRSLSVREWARLQTFPDWYQFAGKRTTGGIRRAGNPRAGIHDRELPKYTQIGNSVPVFLAKAVGLHFKNLLAGH